MEVEGDAHAMLVAVATEVPLVDGDMVVAGWEWEH